MTEHMTRSQILLQAATALGWTIRSPRAGERLIYRLTYPGLDQSIILDAPLLDHAQGVMLRILGELITTRTKRPRADSDMNAIRARLAALETQPRAKLRSRRTRR